MKKSLRLAAAVLSVALLAGSFSACTGGTTSSTSKAAGTSQAATGAGTLDTSKEVEVSMYVVSDRPAKQDEIDANFNKLFKEKLNCTLKVNWIGWAEYANKYPLLFSSGEKFDMAYSATWLNYASLAQKGAFKSLDELWPTYAPKNFERQSEAALAQATVDGKYYCVPTLLATYSAFGPIYRTDVVEGTDWDGKMESIADYEKYLAAVKTAHPEMEPFDVYQAGSGLDDVWMNEQGYFSNKDSNFLWMDPKEEGPKLFTWYEYEKTPEFLEMMKRWNDAGYFTKSALSDTDSQKMKGGKSASRVHNPDAYVGEYIDHPEWNIKYANFVTDVSNLPFTQDALVVSNTAENPERALALYELITSDEAAFRAFYYGIEGTSYEVVDGQFKNLDSDSYATSACWAARTTEFNLDSFGSPADIKTLKSDWDKHITDTEGKYSQRLQGFAINTTSIETEYAAVQNVVQQYWWPLELGYTDPVTGLAEYQQKLEAAGIEKVRETLQKQLDDYLATLK